MNQNSNLDQLRKWVEKVDKNYDVIFMYIEDEPMTAKAYGLKEGDGPVLFSEFDERITTDVNRMKRYINGRLNIEPAKG